MRILYADTFTVYPLGLAGGHRVIHTLLRTAAERPGVECRTIVPKVAVGAPRPEYFPQPRDFAALGIREHRDEGDRWLFDCGYPIWVVDDLEAALAEALDDFAPAVLLTTSVEPEALVRLGRRHGVPPLMYLQDIRCKPEGARAVVEAGGRILACSGYMARWLEEVSGIRAEVFYPVVPAEEYRVEPGPGGFLTMINPVPLKGLEVFLELAPLLPEEAFLVVESWPLNDDRESVRARLERFPNVRFLPRVADIRQVYQQTRVLLVPSKFQEPAGRVVVEAQVSGIPVLVSDRGGLPEMVGEGGLVVKEPEDPRSWVEAIRRLRQPGEMERLSRLARENAGRPDFSPQHLVDRLLAVCREMAAA